MYVHTLQVLKKILFPVGTSRQSMSGLDFGLVKATEVKANHLLTTRPTRMLNFF